MSTEQHEALPQLSGASLLDIKSLAAQAENAAITARSRTDTLIQAYLELQKQNVKQHALIVQMADALTDLHAMAERYRPPGYSTPDAQKKAAYAIAAATQYLKGPKT